MAGQRMVRSRGGQIFVLSLMLLIFGVGMLGVGTWAIWRDGDTEFALVWAGILIPVVAILVWSIIAIARENRTKERGELREIPPLTQLPPADRRWTFAELAGALATRFADSPYTVRGNNDTLVIQADLADARWRHLATVRDLKDTFVVTLEKTREGTLRRTDETRTVEWHAGVPSIGGIEATMRSGREWSYRRRVEIGVTERGIEKPVDYEFSTEDINRPLGTVLKDAWWKTALPAAAKGALMMAAMAVLPWVVIVPYLLLTR